MQMQTELLSFAVGPSVPYAAAGEKLFHATAQLQTHAFKTFMRYQIEALAFLKHRCEQEVKLAEDLVATTGFKDAFDIFSSFFEDAASEYTTEAGRVASISSKIASETAKRARQQADTAIQDRAAKTVA